MAPDDDDHAGQRRRGRHILAAGVVALVLWALTLTTLVWLRPAPYARTWQIVLGQLCAGQAFAASHGLYLGLPAWFIVGQGAVQGAVVLLLFLPVLLTGGDTVRRRPFLGKLIAKTRDRAERFRARFGPYGVVALLALLVFPLWNTGPIPVAVVGTIFGLSTISLVATVMVGNAVGLTLWILAFDELTKLLTVLGVNRLPLPLPALVLIVVIGVAVVTRGRDRESKEATRGPGQGLYPCIANALVAPMARRVLLDPRYLIAKAERLTNAKLEDEGALYPQLASLLEDLGSKKLTGLGRVVLEQSILGFLKNRVVAEIDLRNAPDGETAALRQPIFIIGLQRTGTTFLQALLGDSPPFRSFRLWELLNPSPALPEPVRRRRARWVTLAHRLLAPELASIHPVHPEAFEECLYLLGSTFVVLAYDLHLDLPTYASWLEGADIAAHYTFFRKQINLLCLPDETRRLVLKCPDHLWNLDALLKAFPDACFVWTHRDPCQVVPSCCSLSAVTRRLLFGTCDAHALGKHVTKKMSIGIKRALAARKSIAPHRIIDVAYTDLVEDPLGTVRRIYDGLGVSFSAQAEEVLRAKIVPNHIRSRHDYSLEQYGLDQSTIAQSFSGYKRFLAECFGASADCGNSTASWSRSKSRGH